MQQLTEHEKKILELVKKHPEIVDDRSAREKVANEVGISEKTLRNRIADLKRYGLINISDGKLKNIENTQLSEAKPISNIKYKIIPEGLEIQESQEIDIWGYIQFLYSWKKTIFWITSIFVILSIIVSLLLPKWYKAQAIIMPPSGESPLGIGSIISDFSLGGAGFFQESSETYTYMAILKSRTLATSIINHFNLIEKYNVKNMQLAVTRFQDNASFDVEEEGTIKVTVLDKDQYLVDDIVNFIVEDLDRIVKKLSSEKARNNRLFIEDRVNQTKEKLRKAEDELKEFQEEHGVIAIQVQTEETIRAAAELKAQIVATEVQLGVLEQLVNVNNPEYEALELRLVKLKEEYDVMKFSSDSLSKRDIFQPLWELPELGLQYARLYSEVEMLGTVLEFLLPEYEQAKIKEAKDTPTVQFLDRAVTPEYKYKPKRILIVIISTFIGGFLSVVYVSVKSSIKKSKN